MHLVEYRKQIQKFSQINHFKFYKDIEKKIIKDCKMYNIKCIDTSENRQILFNQLLDEVKCELNI